MLTFQEWLEQKHPEYLAEWNPFSAAWSAGKNLAQSTVLAGALALGALGMGGGTAAAAPPGPTADHIQIGGTGNYKDGNKSYDMTVYEVGENKLRVPVIHYKQTAMQKQFGGNQAQKDLRAAIVQALQDATNKKVTGLTIQQPTQVSKEALPSGEGTYAVYEVTVKAQFGK
jgi:hypothetical protein